MIGMEGQAADDQTASNALTIMVKMTMKTIENMINLDESFNQTATEYIYEYGDDEDKMVVMIMAALIKMAL